MALAQKALDEVDKLEEQMTVYRPESEICSINRHAASAPQKVEPRLLGLLDLACRISRETQGAFDITSGPLSRCWGFADRQGRFPSPGEVDCALQKVGYQHLELDAAASQIFFGRPLELNLGGIGKGFALDRAAEILHQGGLHDFVLHGGQSSILASGHSPASGGRGWPVAVRHPRDGGRCLGRLDLQDLALATSGTAEQSFQHGGRRWGHIIDPRTGYPAQNNMNVTVLAPTAARADALSTAFYMMRRSQVEEYCSRHDDVGALIVEASDSPPGSKLHRHGIAEQLNWTT